MNAYILKGTWNGVKGEVKQTWGRLTDNNFAVMSGGVDKFRGFLQRRYGHAKEITGGVCTNAAGRYKGLQRAFHF